MRYLIASLLIAVLLLSACAPARQKLSPQANVALKDANVFYQQKNVDKALESYQKVLKDNPDFVVALRRVADINLYYGEQDQSKAIEYNHIAFTSYAKAIAITESFADLKETDQADLRDMKRRQKAAWVRIFNASEQLAIQGNTTDALKGFEIAAELDPERSEPLVKLKDIYENQLKDPVRTEAILLQLLEKKPKEIALLQEVGAFYFNKPDHAKALEYFQKAAVEAPLDINIQMNISFCYYELKDLQNALKSTNIVLELNPMYMDALRNAKAIAIKLEDFENAIAYQIRILEIEESDADYNAICVLLNNAQRFQDLITWGEKWYKYDSTSTMAAQFVYLAASKLQNKPLIDKYNKILQSLQ